MYQRPAWMRPSREELAIAETRKVMSVFNEREAAKQKERAEKMQRLWAGFKVGDVVILSAAITKASYGLNLCDDNGEAVLMDGEIYAIEGEFATVKIGRLNGKPAPGRGPVIGELQQVKRSDVVRVSDKPPTLWRDAKDAMKAAAQRDGRKAGDRSQFWSAG